MASTFPATPSAANGSQSVGDPEQAGLPSSLLTGWAGVEQLPKFPKPERCSLCCERSLGTFVVSMLVGMFVSITYIISTSTPDVSASAASRLCRIMIFSEAAIAYSCLWILQWCNGCFFVRRTPQTCFPIPDELARNLRHVAQEDAGVAPASVTTALKEAASGMSNVRDPDGVRGVYCVRCFVWRDEEGHHCSECQRCTNEFDHHCGVLGCCVGGGGLRGNMWAFTTLLSMAAAGLVTMLGTCVTVNTPALHGASMDELLSRAGVWVGGCLLLCCGGYAGYRGFRWFFYDRHAHLRINKRRSA